MQPFLALITPLPPTTPPSSGGPVDPGYENPADPVRPPGTPPGYWGGGPHPMPPIYTGGGTDPGHGGSRPGGGLGFWGGGPHPMPPIAPPGEQPPPITKPPTPGLPVQLPSQDPSEGGWVYAYVPGYGWTWIQVAPGTPPVEPPPDTGNLPPRPTHPDMGIPRPEPQ